MRVFLSTPLWDESRARLGASAEYADAMYDVLVSLGHEPLAPRISVPKSLDRNASRVSAAWLAVSDFAVFATDLGISDQMRNEMAVCMVECIPMLNSTMESLLYDVSLLADVVRGDASLAVVNACCPWKIRRVDGC